jgi:fibronectin type 3 domain-containing protein
MQINLVMKMKYIYQLFFGLFIISTSLFSQKNEFCHEGPIGIFISGGKQIPNGVKIKNIVIERKEDKSDWKKLVELVTPATESEFKLKFADACKYFPDYSLPSDKKLSAIWSNTKFGLSDSLGFWGSHPAVKMALGLMYYDLDVKKNTLYYYRIILNGTTYESKAFSLPFNPVFDELHFSESWYNNDDLNFKWYSIGKNPANSLKVFTYNEQKKPVEVKADVLYYKNKDTSFYVFIHKGLKAGVDRQYSIVGLDQYENSSLNSAQAVIAAVNSNAVYFTKTKAEREIDMLGVKLNFKLSTLQNVKSIHVFKSNDAGKTFKELSSVSGTDTIYFDENVQPDKIYYYYFAAFDNRGALLKKSNTIFSYALDKRKPITPFVNYAKGIKNGIELQFSCTDEFLKSYRVHRKGNEEIGFKIIYETVANDFSKPIVYKDTAQELSPKQFYSYYVTVINTSGKESDSSNQVIERPLKNTFPNAPAFFNVYYQDSVIHLDWENMKVNDWTIKGYKVFKKIKGETKYAPLFANDSILEFNRVKDNKFEYGKTYDYAIETIDQFNNISKSKMLASVTLYESKMIPPGGLKAVNTALDVVLEWEALQEKDIKGYAVYRYQREQTPVKLAKLDSKELSYIDKSAKKGQLYFYYITSINSKDVESAGSEEVSVRK